jgi:O-methyltransferase involved in polyketide biosynthesis
MNHIDRTEIPNAGRVYDYLLGGTHHLEADRQAAEFMLQLVPSLRKWLRRLRMFLHHTASQLASEGFDQFLDLGSGLPTEEHIHATVPGARVVYTDIDPVVVAHGTQIIADNPNVRYLQADIRDVASILESAEVHELLSRDRRLAVGFNAVTCFLTEDEISDTFRALYDWAAPGSKLFATFESKDEHSMTPAFEQLLAMFEQMGSPYHFLTLPRSKRLIEPWHTDARGFLPLDEWLDSTERITASDREGVGLEFYGAILVKD